MKQRPISPHLTIYKLQITSGMSIFHRITGAFLYLGIIILSWAIFCLVYFPNIIENLVYFLQNNIILLFSFKLLMLSWIFSLFYHQLNGLRHLFWDVGKGFDLNLVYISGRLVLLFATLLTIICWNLS